MSVTNVGAPETTINWISTEVDSKIPFRIYIIKTDINNMLEMHTKNEFVSNLTFITFFIKSHYPLLCERH